MEARKKIQEEAYPEKHENKWLQEKSNKWKTSPENMLIIDNRDPVQVAWLVMQF